MEIKTAAVMLTIMVSNATSVKEGLIESIITNAPVIVITAEINCVSPSCSVSATFSRSLVTRLRISPFLCVS